MIAGLTLIRWGVRLLPAEASAPLRESMTLGLIEMAAQRAARKP